MRTKNIDLEDIGFIGMGRPMTEEETRLVSASIKAFMATYKGPRYKATKPRKASSSLSVGPSSRAKKAKRAPNKRKPKARTVRERA